MKWIYFLVITLYVGGASADSWESLVQKLTQVRADLETLSRESESLQRDKQSELDQWTQRRSEAEAQVQREKLRELQIGEKLKRLEARVKNGGKTDPQAPQKLLKWIERFQTWVPTTIPFHHEQRLAALDKLKTRAQKKHEAMEFVLADFWSFVESEIKLSQTNEYRIVDVKLGEVTKKCEVARLGLVALFVVTPDGKVLQASRDSQGWQWRDVEASGEQESILSLVKNLKNKNESDIYKLPIDQKIMGAGL